MVLKGGKPVVSENYKDLICDVCGKNLEDFFSTNKLWFTKMHGCGNDYIYFNGFTLAIKSPERLAPILCDRNKGIGGDGVVVISPSTKVEARLDMFTVDGTQATMSGNAIRCAGKFLYDNRIINDTRFGIETVSGISELELILDDNGKVTAVCVDLGPAFTKPEEIPVNLTGEVIVGRTVTINNQKYEITCVSVGNPHAVIFHDDIDHFDLHIVGPQFEDSPLFPERVSLEIVEVINRNHLRMRVWERGAGETMSCGTGACAVAVAAVLMGYCNMDEDIIVELRGGTLIIKYTEETVFMTGDCVKVFDGKVEI